MGGKRYEVGTLDPETLLCWPEYESDNYVLAYLRMLAVTCRIFFNGRLVAYIGTRNDNQIDIS